MSESSTLILLVAQALHGTPKRDANASELAQLVVHGVAQLLPVSDVEGEGGGTRMQRYMYTRYSTLVLLQRSTVLRQKYWFGIRRSHG
jgi:hypothetical protein